MTKKLEGISLTAAGALLGISREAIRKATEGGRIARLADGSVCRESVLRYATIRRAPRGGAHHNHASRQPQPQPQPATDDPQPCVDARELCREALVHSTCIAAGALDLAPILLRFLPEHQARQVVEAWTAEQRRQLVGGEGGPAEPYCTTEAWPDPPGGGLWRDHEWFTAPMAGIDWQEAAIEASAWRAQHGLAAP